MNKKILTLEEMQNMTIDNIIQKTREGYDLSLHLCQNKLNQQGHINMDLGTSTCPPSLPRGATRTPSITLSTPGTPPYTYKFYVDGALKHTSPSATATTYNGYTHTFDETAGNHTYKYEVTDSCTTGAKTDYSQCIINILAAPILPTITISPSSETLNIGSIRQFTFICKDESGATITCPALTWESSNPSVGSINSSTGLFTAIGQGTTTITASAEGKTSNTATITVSTQPLTLTSIAISPPSAPVVIGNTQQFTAIPKDQFGNTMTGITITWSITDTTKGTISPTTGLSTTFTGVAEGTTTIKAASGTVVGTASVAITTTPPAAGGGTIAIAVAALLAAVILMSRKQKKEE